MMKPTKAAYSISSIEGERFAPDQGSALSGAITVGTRLQRRLTAAELPTSVYVRDQLDKVTGRVDVSVNLISVHTLAPRRNF